MSSKLQKLCSGLQVLTVKIRQSSVFQSLNYKTQESQNISFHHISFLFDPLARDIINNRSNAAEIRFMVYYLRKTSLALWHFFPKTKNLQPLALNVPCECN